MLFTGETSFGKSVVVKDFLITLDERVNPAFVNFSGKPTCRNQQDAFEDNLDLKRKNLLALKMANTRKVFFIDYINMPSWKEYFGKPP